MLHGRKPSIRAMAAGPAVVGPVAAAAVFVGVCLLLVLILSKRPVDWRAIDLQVYRAGASALLHGRDVYAAHPQHSNLSFTYPPFAALSFVPMTLLGPVGARAALTALSAIALVVCIGLCVRMVRPGWTAQTRWTLALVVGAAALFTDPVYSTLSFGQVNLLLMALVLLDLLGRRTVLPRGVLVGLATAVKLTPGIFVVYLALTRRPRAAVVAGTVVLASMAAGYLVAPGPSSEYWSRLVFEPRRVGGLMFAGNQSLRGVVARLSRDTGAGPVWMLSALVILVVGMWLATRAHRGRDELLGVSLCAVTGLLVSPVSWNHHWVWALPVAILLWGRFLDLRAPGRLAVAAGWTALFYLAPIWWVPNQHRLEYTQHGVQLLAGNAYVLTGLVLLACAPLLIRRSTPPRPTTREPTAPAALQDAAR